MERSGHHGSLHSRNSQLAGRPFIQENGLFTQRSFTRFGNASVDPEKVKREGVQVILVAPDWVQSSWYTDALTMRAGFKEVTALKKGFLDKPSSFRSHEETCDEDNFQQVTVLVEPRQQNTVVGPEEEKHGEASGFLAKICLAEETGSQRSEEDDEVPVTDIYFFTDGRYWVYSPRLNMMHSASSSTDCPPDDRSWVYSPLHYNTQVQSVLDEESDTVSN
ncbi:phosphatidylinositol 4-phosphate 5-kinase type-1 gamma-like [Mixophyes fleayi]|uniref:phosphatidylinositol 4-phosphate 5-kinase type-1 gamma-like n=1 Tax=Mixophyes fleayi TaxID=3061075 RepID=UPI003F4DC965